MAKQKSKKADQPPDNTMQYQAISEIVSMVIQSIRNGETVNLNRIKSEICAK
jgi:hypothetical protein